MRRRLAIAIMVALGGIAWAAAHWATHKAVVAEPVGHPRGPHGPSDTEAVGAGYLSTSLTLCLALALVLTAAAALQSRSRASRGRSLWLFGVVPVLGLLVEVFAAAPSTPAGIGSGLVELAPLALVTLVVQVAVALVALRVAHGILDVAAALARALVGPRTAPSDAGGPVVRLERADSARSPRLSYAGRQRAPPALLPAV